MEIQLFVFIVPNKTSSVQCRDGAGFPMNLVFDFNVHTYIAWREWMNCGGLYIKPIEINANYENNIHANKRNVHFLID